MAMNIIQENKPIIEIKLDETVDFSDKIETLSQTSYDFDAKEFLDSNSDSDLLENKSNVDLIFEYVKVPEDVKQEVLSSWNHSPSLRSLAMKYGHYVDSYEFHKLAGLLELEVLKRRCPLSVSEYLDIFDKRLNNATSRFIRVNSDVIEKMVSDSIVHEKDNDYFSVSTLAKSYLLKTHANEQPMESPNMMNIRIAAQLYGSDHYTFDEFAKCYDELTNKYYTHASPTMFNAGTRKHQLSSCFLVHIPDDLGHILYTGVGDCGQISKSNGGLGIDVSSLRYSEINGGGKSSGLFPVLKVYDATIGYVDQGGSRKGAGTIFCTPHHLDVEKFIICKDPTKSATYLHDINICLWMNNVFFKRLANNENYTLFCPKKASMLKEKSGVEFEQAYIRTEKMAIEIENRLVKQETLVKNLSKQIDLNPSNVELRKIHHKETKKLDKLREQKIDHKIIKASDLLNLIVKSQQHGGMPYMMNGDSANQKSNQKNLGYISQSNLCLEIIEKSDGDNIPSCNLGAFSVKAFARAGLDHSSKDQIADMNRAFDFQKLSEISRSLCKNLNRVIDVNRYPLDKYDEQGNVVEVGKIRKNNMKNRPIGMGVHGFADALYKMDIGFEDPRADLFNTMFFACVYFNALAESVRLAVVDGPYENFKTGSFKKYVGNHKFVELEGSPFSHGLLQFDLWEEEYNILKDYGYDVSLRNPEDDKPMHPSCWNQQTVALPNGDHIEPTWESLKEAIKKYGTRNSLLTALMPTASTAQILCNTESVEAPMSFIFSRNTMSGSFPVVNSDLCNDLEAIGVWNERTAYFIILCDGSIEHLENYVLNYPQYYPMFYEGSAEDIDNRKKRLKYLVEKKYKTMWELSQKIFLNFAAKRGRYVDQSQSTNIYLARATEKQLEKVQTMGFGLSLKTLNYYIRQRPATNCGQFTMDQQLSAEVEELKNKTKVSEVKPKKSVQKKASSESNASASASVNSSEPVETNKKQSTHMWIQRNGLCVKVLRSEYNEDEGCKSCQ